MAYPAYIQWEDSPQPIKAGNPAFDGTGTAPIILVATAETYVEKIVFRPAGTNEKTLARLFINNGSTPATAANNNLIADLALPATIRDFNDSMGGVELPLGIIVPTGYQLLCTLVTTVEAGWFVTAFAGDYPNLGPA